jgi:glycerol-3-phosphate dehydrogenase
VLNYAAVESFLIEGGKAIGALVRDTLAGAHGARVRARLMVNAAGPWVDAVRALESAGAAPKLKLSKGIHLVVDRERLPVSHTVIMPAADRRSVFAVPKGRATYLGTTDTFYPTADAWPTITAQDADYLLDAAAKRFSSPPLTHQDIASAWSGVRPLVGEEGKSASEISRKDELWTGPAGVLSIAGGKLTAYRRMAERVVDRIEEGLGRGPSASRTAVEPLAGGDVNVAAAVAGLRGLAQEDADRLVALYGAEAAAVAADGADVAAEARRSVLAEGAVTLEDYWVRRSARAWFGEGGGLAALPAAAAAMAPLLGWSAETQRRQIEGCRAIHAASLAALKRETVGGEAA